MPNKTRLSLLFCDSTSISCTTSAFWQKPQSSPLRKKTIGSSSLKSHFHIPDYHLPYAQRRCLSYRHSITSTWFSLTLAGKSQTPPGFPVLGPQGVFLFSFLQISRYTGHHSAHMSPSSMPRRISVLDRAGNGPARSEETEMQHRAHQL